MADETKDNDSFEEQGGGVDAEGGGGTAVKEKPAKKPAGKRKPPGFLPPWKVLLHNDDENDILTVIETIMMLTPLDERESKQRTKEAHESGVALLLVTHRERAELYQEQFTSRGLTVTIEQAEK